LIWKVTCWGTRAVPREEIITLTRKIAEVYIIICDLLEILGTVRKARGILIEELGWRTWKRAKLISAFSTGDQRGRARGATGTVVEEVICGGCTGKSAEFKGEFSSRDEKRLACGIAGAILVKVL